MWLAQLKCKKKQLKKEGKELDVETCPIWKSSNDMTRSGSFLLQLLANPNLTRVVGADYLYNTVNL